MVAQFRCPEIYRFSVSPPLISHGANGLYGQKRVNYRIRNRRNRGLIAPTVQQIIVWSVAKRHATRAEAAVAVRAANVARAGVGRARSRIPPGLNGQRARSRLATAACAHLGGREARGGPASPVTSPGGTRGGTPFHDPTGSFCPGRDPGGERDLRDCSASPRRNPPCLTPPGADM